MSIENKESDVLETDAIKTVSTQTWIVKHFSNLKLGQEVHTTSPVFSMFGRKWMMYLYPGIEDENKTLNVGIYMGLAESESALEAKFRVSIINPFTLIPNIISNTGYHKYISGSQYGTKFCLERKTLLDETKGLIANDSVVFEIEGTKLELKTNEQVKIEQSSITLQEQKLMTCCQESEPTLHVWKIKNFSKLDKNLGSVMWSEALLGPNESQWKLSIYPGQYAGSSEIKEIKDPYISIYLGSYDDTTTKYIGSAVKFTVCIVSKDKKDVYSASAFTQINKTNYSLCTGWNKFIRRSTLLEESDYLENDVLTLKLTLQIVTTSSSNVPIINGLVVLQNDLRRLLTHDKSQDVSFAVGNKKMGAHKLVLCMRSPVFATMFSLNMKETIEKQIIIDDIHASTFGVFLNYLYTAKIEPYKSADQESVNYRELLAVAHRYEISDLVDICAKHLCETICLDNIQDLVAMASRYDCNILSEACIEFAKDNPKTLMSILCLPKKQGANKPKSEKCIVM